MGHKRAHQRVVAAAIAEVAQLRAAGCSVRAAVRTVDARSARLTAQGAEVVATDLLDADSIAAAMRGVRRAYFVPPIHALAVQAAVAFANAARAEKLEHVVLLSQWLAGTPRPSLMSRQHALIDQLFRDLSSDGITCTIVRPGFFADLPYVELSKFAAQLGVLPLPVAGAALDAPPSVEDIARVAVAALREPAKRAGRDYRPTGPALLSVTEMAAAMGRVYGHNVTHLSFMPRWLLRKAMRQEGMSPFLVAQFGHYLDDLAAGGFAVGAPTNDVLEATGQAPESFEAVLRRYAAKPAFKRTLGSRLVAAWRFAIVPCLPGRHVALVARHRQ